MCVTGAGGDDKLVPQNVLKSGENISNGDEQVLELVLNSNVSRSSDLHHWRSARCGQGHCQSHVSNQESDRSQW